MVGLGNPGAEFDGTRHNAGADAVRLVAERNGGGLRSEKGLSSLACEVRLGDHRVMLAIPLTYMNESGLAVAPLVRRAGLEEGGAVSSRLIVVHDELDLPAGRVKMKSGGGNAGNNGLRSIERHLHTADYLRVRIGIGKPPGRQSGADYVLKRPARAERELLEAAIEEAADAVESIATVGFDATMSRVNAAD